MAWSSAALASYETSRLALDKPLVAVQTIPASPTHCKWVDEGQIGAGDVTTWTDRSASANPARRSHDGYPGYITKHSGATTDDIYYLAFDFGATITFDCVFLIGHNAGTLSLVNDLVLQVADDNNFSTNLTTMANFGTPTDDTRLADLTMNGGNNRITAQYAWLKFDKTGTNIIPEVGELILGRRRQLEYKPDRPFDDSRLRTWASTARTQGNIAHKTIWSQRAFELEASWMIDDSTYESDWQQFHRDADGRFVWVYDPSTSPQDWHFMSFEEDGLVMPEVGPSVREVSIHALEVGPESYHLDVELNG
jgi:hypothetical protein